ncbi:MAG: glycosyltransferase family 4 protein [Bacteroidales bacterium]|nr:glycosyltransferase family 4 protein [Bacteroidales bacterium]
MRIAVNTRLLLPGRLDGIGWFTFETLRRIVEQHPEHEFLFLFDRKPDPQFLFGPNVRPITLCPQARHPVLWWLYFEWSVPFILRKERADVFLSPEALISLRTKVPTLTVVHDLNFEHASDFLRPSHQWFMKHFSPRYAHKAQRIATVSEFSKSDIVSTYGVEEAKIDVVYDGSHSTYRPLDAATQQEVRQRYADGHRYFIFIGTISKRKNLTNILLAYDRMRTLHPEDESHLLVVGHRYWWEDELKEAYDGMSYQRDVHFIGRADAEELALLLGSATALVYCSLFEGFGIPILEAFQAEVPVLTSNVTSMPEVAGDAALLVPPLSVKAMADALYRLSSKPSLRHELVVRGRHRRQLFSWDLTAQLLWQSLCRLHPSLH